MTLHRLVARLCCCGALAHLGCVGEAELEAPSQAPGTITAPRIPSGVFGPLKLAADAHADLCANDGLHPNFPDDADAVTRALCQDVVGGVAAAPQSLAELQALLGLDFKDPTAGNGEGGNPAFTLNGHSSSLVARLVSALNPRALVFTPPPTDGSRPSGYVVLAFTRGEQLVEVAAHDPTLDQVNLYLLRFDQACNGAPSGCGPGDLLTPSIERGWQNVRAYESSTELRDTILDCRQCHQPDVTQPQVLRMPELSPPYTHFFSNATVGGQALLADFHGAHGYAEDYGPIPAGLIDQSDPAKLAQLVIAAGFADQPNAFDSAQIEHEVQQVAPYQPAWNSPPGSSDTWKQGYQTALQGEAIAVPYHDVKVTDPSKLARMSAAYKDVSSGARPASELLDIRDVFLDRGLRDMGFAPALGLDGRALLTQVCHQCHNSKLDQTISRARFDVDTLDSLSSAEKQAAVTRLSLSDDAPGRMPPPLFRTLTADERARLVDVLSR